MSLSWPNIPEIHDIILNNCPVKKNCIDRLLTIILKQYIYGVRCKGEGIPNLVVLKKIVEQNYDIIYTIIYTT